MKQKEDEIMGEETTRRVSDREYQKAFDAMCADLEAQTGYNGKWGRITFQFSAPEGGHWKDPKVMQVNWAAIGNTLPSEAAGFGKALMVAAKLAEGFIYNGYTVFYED